MVKIRLQITLELSAQSLFSVILVVAKAILSAKK